MKKVRIYRYRRESGDYEYSDYSCTASIRERSVTSDGGAQRSPEGSIRIMTREKINVSPGDYAAVDSFGERPDKNRDFLISAVRDNRRGTLPHWRLIFDGGR